ncbi:MULTISPECIES: hypothetical protein [Deefgea]|uniref:Integrase n=1 Tax=Deefgea chitinilytica TaxID=570276 RepID=A0ABS2C929_9NEIS|nr:MULTISPECIES: hypothetical protein [Deefgea]MBM5570552.1 hypothetical protein [Deefgea chitinilytica]MBM9887781.1 hypothetical protein [Deefgea sp. CFH1-16]
MGLSVLNDVIDGLIVSAPPGFLPENNTIISYASDGSVKSRFSDDSWVLNSNELRAKSGTIFFLSECDLEAKIFVKYITYLLMFRKKGRRLSDRTLINYSGVVGVIAKFIFDRKCDYFLFFSNQELIKEFFSGASGWQKETAGSIFAALSKLDFSETGFKIVDCEKMFKLKGVDRVYREKLKQHPPLPTRIYSIILTRLSEKIIEWQEIKTEVMHLVSHSYLDKLWGRTKESKLYRKNKPVAGVIYPKFEDVCSENLANYLIKNGYLYSVRGLTSLIGDVQLAVKLTVQAYTGMRDDEASTLPLYCDHSKKFADDEVFWIDGFSTKMNNGQPAAASWITNSTAVDAVKIAQEIAVFISDLIDFDYKDETKNTPLFVSVGYLWGLRPESQRLQPGVLNLATMKKFRKWIQPKIEIDDIKELQQIDLHRAWSAESNFKVGSAWHFSSHQLRRSLAVYAHRSGIVSLPSLRRQLQHLTNAMTKYYARGALFALDFISPWNTDHFVFEWQNASSSSSAIGYIKNVLETDDSISGGHGSWVELRIKSDAQLLTQSRETIVKMFQRGDISYKETPIGGCTSTVGCHQPAINWLSLDCLKSNCKNMVCTSSKLSRLIKCQESFVNQLEVDSIEHKIEISALNVMYEAYKKLS